MVLQSHVEEIELDEQSGSNAAPSITVSQGQSQNISTQQPAMSPVSASSSPVDSPPAATSPETTRCYENICNICNRPRGCSPRSDMRSAGSTTLVSSSPPPQAGSGRSSPARQGASRRSSLQSTTTRPWSQYAHHAINTQTLLAWSLAALTVATVVYCIRADRIQRYNNRLDFFDHCREVNVSSVSMHYIRRRVVMLT